MIYPELVARVDPLLSATFRTEAEELDALAQALSAERSFALLAVSVTTRSHRQRLERELDARVTALKPGRKLLRLELKEPIESLLGVLATAAAEQQPDAILLSGIEGCFAALFSRRGQQVLAQLEADRERLAAVGCPVLVWLPAPLLYALVGYARKLFQTTAKVYLFAEASAALDTLLARIKVAPPDEQVIADLGEQLLAVTGRPLFQDDLPPSTTTTIAMKGFRQRLTEPAERRIREWPLSLTPGVKEYFAIGVAASRTRNFQLAVMAYDKAGRLAAEADRSKSQILANLGRAEAQQALGNLPDALDAARFALMLAKGFGETELAQRAAQLLQPICQQLAAQHDQSAHPQQSRAAPRAQSAQQPTRESLRALLAAYLVTESTFDMFCLENFLHVAATHSMVLGRGERTELLLDAVAPQQLVAAVGRTANGKDLVEGGRLLKFT